MTSVRSSAVPLRENVSSGATRPGYLRLVHDSTVNAAGVVDQTTLLSLTLGSVLLELGWSKARLAREARVHVRTVKRWLSGTTAVDVADVLRVPVVRELFTQRLYEATLATSVSER